MEMKYIIDVWDYVIKSMHIVYNCESLGELSENL